MKLTKTFLIAFGIGIAVIAVIVAGTLVKTKPAHLQLDGKVLKVRTLASDDQHSIVVADFRAQNVAGIEFMSREAKIVLIKADGSEFEGDTIARTDLDRVFDYYKVLGPKYNPVLIQRDRIRGGETMDRMVAAAFNVPESDVDSRRNVIVRLFDVDGLTFDLKER